MRKIAKILCLMMMTAGLSGCIGGTDVETDEGDDVILGESPDDWPTYYVPTASSLPTCDSTILGRLYYVEDVTEFQACTSTGWTTINIGGGGAALVLNQAPLLNAELYYGSDDWMNDDGDGTHSLISRFRWNATDLDGSIASVGVDYDNDGVVDEVLPGDVGSSSEGSFTSSSGFVQNGFFLIPVEQGLTFERTVGTGGDGGWGGCAIAVHRMISVIAVDDDGGTTTVRLLSSATNLVGNTGFVLIDPYSVDEHDYLEIPQADIDWVNGVSTASTCDQIPVFTLTFDANAVSSGTTDVLGVLTLVSGSATNFAAPYGDCSGSEIKVGTSAGNDNMGYPCDTFDVQYSGSDSANPQAGDTWTIVEDGTDICTSTTVGDWESGLCTSIYLDIGFTGKNYLRIYSS